MSMSKATISEIIVKFRDPKLGYTPPKIFKQRARLIKLIAEASMALNEHMKVMDDPDFMSYFDNENKLFAAIEEALNDSEELEYNLAHATERAFLLRSREMECGRI